VPGDRSLDVSYDGGTIELSFARLGDPLRAMYARVLTWSDETWTYYGLLTTEQANTVGVLTTAPEEQVEILDGVNTAPGSDRYVADDLPAGRYLICTTLAEDDDHGHVCGEVAVS
jgi:hypothetical protein